MHSVRIPGAAVAAALATMGIAAGAAEANTENVVPTVKHEMRTMKRAVASENLKHTKANTPAEARRAEPKFRALATALDRAATAVSRSSTTSTTQRSGKRDWVLAVRGVAKGYRQFDYALVDIARGSQTAAKREALRAEGTVLRAAKTLVRADRLLKIHSS